MVLNKLVHGILGLVFLALSASAHAQPLVSLPMSPPPPASIAALMAVTSDARPVATAAARAAADSAALLHTSQSGRHRGRPDCQQKMRVGLVVGAAVGAAHGALAWKGVDEPGKTMAASTGLFGLMGLAVGYKLCR